VKPQPLFAHPPIALLSIVHPSMAFLNPFLCDYCQDIFRGHIEEEDSESRNTSRPDRSLGEFEQQAFEGCYICHHVWTQLAASIQNHKTRHITARIMNGDGGKVTCEIVHPVGEPPHIEFLLDLNLDREPYHFTTFSLFPYNATKDEGKIKR